MATLDLRERSLRTELAGLDALESMVAPRPSLHSRVWSAVWPKCLAAGIAVLLWQIVVWSHFRPDYVIPGPAKVFPRLYDDFGTIMDAVGITMWRAVQGFALAILIGTAVGALVAHNRVLRSGFGSLVTGLMTMPSVAWVPLAIGIFQLSDATIRFVVVIGAAPSIANGLISGIDNIQPVIRRAGRVLGAHGWSAFRHVTLPAALPAFVGGLKQGWAFAWRSLLAAELIALIPGKLGIGQLMENDRQFTDYTGVICIMIVILIIGIVVDEAIFGNANRWIRRRYGLIDDAAGA
ncbi:MAG TPA: ABC transporter permease [Acidimicrobiia bacterium]|nr:ABC transporter permease [Acidimicrobiia bacterium]